MATSLDISLDKNLNQWGLCFMLYIQNSAYWYQDTAPWNVFGFLYKKKFKQRRCILRRYKSVSYLINIHSLERCLQKLKIVNVLMLQLRLKFYFLQTNAAWEEHVHELAVGRSWKETRTGQVWVWRRHVWLRGTGQEGAPCPQPSWLHPHLLVQRGWVPDGRDVSGCSSSTSSPLTTVVQMLFMPAPPDSINNEQNFIL